jgi:hypothetical protein
MRTISSTTGIYTESGVTDITSVYKILEVGTCAHVHAQDSSRVDRVIYYASLAAKTTSLGYPSIVVDKKTFERETSTQNSRAYQTVRLMCIF